MAESPFTAAELDEVLRPFGTSRMLPGPAYTSDEVFGFELDRFFAGSWNCAGRSADLAERGGQRAVRAGSQSVLLTRGDDDALRGFANVCRHRGHELLAAGDCVARPAVVCPYHAWSYDLDGTLRAAPRFRGGDVDPAQHGLVAVPIVDWHGWVFVNASGSGPAFDDLVTGLGEVIAPYGAGRLVSAARHDYVVAANWKLIHENYHECYHCPQIHPELCRVSPPTSGRNFPPAGAWVGGVMALRDEAETMSFDGRSGGTRISGLPEDLARSVVYVGLFPDLLMSLHPDYVLTHRLEPLAPGSTRIVCEWLFPPETAAQPGFDPTYAVDFWDRTNRQDWAACESVQRGVASPHFRPGPLAPVEDAVYQFETLVARGYLGESLPAAAQPSRRATQLA